MKKNPESLYVVCGDFCIIIFPCMLATIQYWQFAWIHQVCHSQQSLKHSAFKSRSTNRPTNVNSYLLQKVIYCLCKTVAHT